MSHCRFICNGTTAVKAAFYKANLAEICELNHRKTGRALCPVRRASASVGFQLCSVLHLSPIPNGSRSSSSRRPELADLTSHRQGQGSDVTDWLTQQKAGTPESEPGPGRLRFDGWMGRSAKRGCTTRGLRLSHAPSASMLSPSPRSAGRPGGTHQKRGHLKGHQGHREKEAGGPQGAQLLAPDAQDSL